MDRITTLANELLQAINDSGRTFHDEGFEHVIASISIYVYADKLIQTYCTKGNQENKHEGSWKIENIPLTIEIK